MADKLGLYNQALDLIGEKRLAHLSHGRVARHALDDEYAAVLAECLAQGMWYFAMRTAAASSTSLPTPAHGFTYAYTVPSDCVRTFQLFDSASTLAAQQDAVEISGVYLSRKTPLYVRYVSNGASYGGNLTIWPQTFTRYAYAVLASKVCYTLTRSAEMCKDVQATADAWLLQARAADAVLASPDNKPYNVYVRREFNEGADPMETWPFRVAVPEAGQ